MPSGNIVLHDLDIDGVAPHFKSITDNYTVLYNPRIRRDTSISLVCSIPHDSFVCCVAFHPSGKNFATGSDGEVHIYDAFRGSQVCVLREGASESQADPNIGCYVRCLCFSPDGRYIAAGSEDAIVRVGLLCQHHI